MNTGETFGVARAAALGSLFALPFILTLALVSGVSHDEHQHIAAGVLTAREGLLPYRDYAYFHVPYLAWLYGALFHFTDHYLLASRLVSAACAALGCGVVFGTASTLLRARSRAFRWTVSMGALLALLATPLVGGVVGHSWNQEPSLLFLLTAFALVLPGHSTPGAAWRSALAGLLLGVAAGFRVTILPMVAPLAFMAWTATAAGSRPWRYLALFALGLVVGLLPLVIAGVAAPRGFLFGNVEFPSVNILYRMSTGEPRTMTLAKKARFLFKLVMRPNWLLFYGFLALLLLAKYGWRQRLTTNRPLLCVLIAVPFLLIGAMAPSPSFDQYFFPLAPFLVIGSVALVCAAPQESRLTRAAFVALAAAVALTCFLGRASYRRLPDLARPATWATHDLRVAAAVTFRDVKGGKVLTLAPTWPLEAGLSIYPELATGPFGWRIAPFVDASRRPALHLLAPEDLQARLDADPPAAILTGFDERWEEPLVKFASTNGYGMRALSKGRAVWLAPGSPAAPLTPPLPPK